MTKKILIVDDDPQFLRTMADGLNRSGLQTIICDATSFDALRKSIPQEEFELLWDFGLPVEWLRELQSMHGLADEMRIWIVTGAPDTNLAALQQQLPKLKIQIRQFDKTQDVVGQFVGKVQKQKPGTPASTHDHISWVLGTVQGWFDNYPDPLRIVDSQGEVIWTNSKWEANRYTPPIESDDLALIQEYNSGEWKNERRWGPLPCVDGSSTELLVRNGYYLLRQRLIKIRGELKLLQLLIPQPDPPASNLGEAIDQILKEMIARSFKRARFFRVRYFPDGKEGVLSLEAQQGGIATDTKLPHYRPIKGRRVDDIQS